MRYLIAQGPGYYGVNIRQVDEEHALNLIANGGFTLVEDAKASGYGFVYSKAQGEDGTQLLLVDAPENDMNFSAGFDTGWWDEGEAAINAALKEAGARMQAAWNKGKPSTR